MKINNKGFTFVELIVIVVLLGLIAIMTIPKIIKLTEKTKKDSLALSAFSYIHAIDEACMSNYENDKSDTEDYNFTFNCKLNGLYNVENGILKNEYEVHKIESKGKLPSSGYLTINEGNIEGCLIFEKYAVTIENNETKNVEKGNCNLSIDATFEFTGREQIYKVPTTGYYKLEVWGAQGGGSIMNKKFSSNTGYGGYSTGKILLEKGTKLYINVGGKGTDAIIKKDVEGGYNGGGNGTYDHKDDESAGAGGGATHIALSSGLLSTFENKKDELLIVSGGGGGKSWNTNGGSAGGYIAGATGDGRQANQTTGYAFGKGQDATGIGDSDGHGGGGGGYYGGYESNEAAENKDFGGGGSSYIGNISLTEKSMFCYDCEESNETSTKTISTTGTSTEKDTTNCPNGYSNTPISKCAKAANGYAKITYIGNNLSEEKNNIDVYYSYGTSYHNIYTTNTWATTNSLPTASFLQDSIYLGTNDYYVAYTDTIDLSKYKTVIFKKTGFSTTDTSVRKRAYFAQYIEKTNEAGESYIPTWVEIGTNIYAADISAQTRNDLKFGIDAYGGTNSGNIYYIAFSSDTIEEIKSNNELINSL